MRSRSFWTLRPVPRSLRLVRTYVVQPGDSPASIAAQDSMAGCPKCSCELPRVNCHKASTVRPNGHVTFTELIVGEVLNLPDEWFDPARELLPPAYYKILPHPNGVTRGTLGDAPGDLPALDDAVAAVAQLAALDDVAFTRAVGDAGAKIDAATEGAYGSTTSADAAAKAKLAQDATKWAWQRNADLAAAVAAGDRATVTRARLDIQNSLTTALGNARLAILAQSSPASNPSTFSSELQAAAKGAATAIAADPNYCTSVTHPGNPVNAAVHRFKLAWNATQTPKVPLGSGDYEVATTVALAQVIGQAPSACGPSQRPVPAPKPPAPLTAPAQPKQETVTPPTESGWSAGKVFLGVVLAGAAAAGGVAIVRSRKASPRPAARREGYAP